MREDADFFMSFLPGDPDFGEGHDGIFATAGVSARFTASRENGVSTWPRKGALELLYAFVYNGWLDNET